MAQLLLHNLDHYVPSMAKDDKKITLSTVPHHGDQLFEERARNIKWTFRDGVDGYQKFEAIDTEFADWHAKYTLYKVIPQFTLHYHACTCKCNIIFH